MRGDAPSPAAPSFRACRPLATLTDAIGRALAASDFDTTGALLKEARAQGVPAGRLYVDDLRPALLRLPPETRQRAPLTARINAAVLAHLVASVPTGVMGGAGRAALLWSREDGIEAMDRVIATGFLQADGWTVKRQAADSPAAWVAATVRAVGAELAVAVSTGPEDVLRLMATLTALRRLAQPPVILLADFSDRARQRTGVLTAIVDEVCGDPEELAASAAQRSPAPAERPWEVRLQRSKQTLTLRPTGRFDADTGSRLIELALARLGSFTRLVLDLRDLDKVEPSGLAHLTGWPGLLGPGEAELIVVAGPAVRAQLEQRGAPVELGILDSMPV
jgi:anti-anti-sigma regulatory factor